MLFLLNHFIFIKSMFHMHVWPFPIMIFILLYLTYQSVSAVYIGFPATLSACTPAYTFKAIYLAQHSPHALQYARYCLPCVWIHSICMWWIVALVGHLLTLFCFYDFVVYLWYVCFLHQTYLFSSRLSYLAVCDLCFSSLFDHFKTCSLVTSVVFLIDVSSFIISVIIVSSFIPLINCSFNYLSSGVSSSLHTCLGVGI